MVTRGPRANRLRSALLQRSAAIMAVVMAAVVLSPTEALSDAVTPLGVPSEPTDMRLEADGTISFSVDANNSSITFDSCGARRMGRPSGVCSSCSGLNPRSV